MDFNDPSDWFRDDKQLEAVSAIVKDGLTDDTHQNECRYLMRFWWHLRVSYDEVSWSELQEHLSPRKLEIIDELMNAIGDSGDEVDLWISKYRNFVE